MHKLNSNSKILLAILGALMAITSLSTDIYLPAMPQMQIDLKGDVELTVTGFLIGFAIGQLLWGPISDKLGRIRPLILGLILFIIGSVGCALSENIAQIIIWRIVQAMGACTGPMLSRAMVRDMHGSAKAAEMLSTLMVIMALAPIIGPLMGGQLIKWSSWHSIFWLLTVIGTLMAMALLWLPETYPATKRPNTSFGKAFANYRHLLMHKKFMKYTLCVTFYYVGVYAFITGSPFVYIKYFGVKPQYYGLLFALNIVGIMTLSIINRKLVRKYPLHTILRVSTTISMSAGLLLLVLSNFNVGLLGIVIPIFFFFSMNGIVSATTTAAALEDVPEMAGAASALLGSLQYGSGILSSVLLALFSDGTPRPMSLIIGIFASLSAIVLFFKPNALFQKLALRMK
nr:Bcr/CflA family multidrug efflux MFS transporter [uncultured Carboxylicivirga sp.]